MRWMFLGITLAIGTVFVGLLLSGASALAESAQTAGLVEQDALSSDRWIRDVELRSEVQIGTQGESDEPTRYRVAVNPGRTTENIWAINENPGGEDEYMQRDLYLTLFRYSDYWHSLVPYLATDLPTLLTQQATYSVSIVALKQGVLWSDGSEITAQDVAFTFNTAQALGLGAWSETPLHHVEATGRYTVSFFFTDTPPLGMWPFDMGTTSIVPQHFWSPLVAQALTQPEPAEWLKSQDGHDEPTCGPFKRSTWISGTYAEHVADPLYYFKGLEIVEYANGAYQESLPGRYSFTAYGEPEGEIALSYTYGPYVSAVRYVPFSEPDDAVQALRDGVVDYVFPWGGYITPDDYYSLMAEPDIKVISNTVSAFEDIGFNLRRSPLDMLAFRQAVAVLVDHEYIAHDLSARVQTHTLPLEWSVVSEDNDFWYTPTIRYGEGLTRAQRIDQAVTILSTAGFTWTTTPSWNSGSQTVDPGEGLHYSGTLVSELEIVSMDYHVMRSTTAISVAQWLEEAGIPVTVTLADFGTIVDRVLNQYDFDMYIAGWTTGDPGRPPVYLDSLFHSPNGSSGIWNAFGYSNPTFDALCDTFMAQNDLLLAREYAYQMQHILASDLPNIVLYSGPRFEAYSSATVIYPYTRLMNGLAHRNGMPAVVRLVPTSGTIETSGGTIEGPGASLVLPANAFTDTVVLTYTVQPPPSSTLSAGVYFDITPVYSSTGEPATLEAGATYTIVVTYHEDSLAPGISEDSLMLYYWDDSLGQWTAEPTSVVDTALNTITATPDHFSSWGAFGKHQVFLPYLQKE